MMSQEKVARFLRKHIVQRVVPRSTKRRIARNKVESLLMKLLTEWNMSTIDDIKAAAQNLTDVINAFEAPAPVAGVPVEEVAKVEGEVAAVDAELKADEAPAA